MKHIIVLNTYSDLIDEGSPMEFKEITRDVAEDLATNGINSENYQDLLDVSINFYIKELDKKDFILKDISEIKTGVFWVSDDFYSNMIEYREHPDNILVEYITDNVYSLLMESHNSLMEIIDENEIRPLRIESINI